MRIYVRSMTETELDDAISNGKPFDMGSFKKYKTPAPAPGAVKVKDVRVGDIIENTESAEAVDLGTVFQVVDIRKDDPDGMGFSWDSCPYTFICKQMDAPRVFHLTYYASEGDEYVGPIVYKPSDFICEMPQEFQDEYERQIREVIYPDDPKVDEIVQNYLDSRVKDVDGLFRDLMSQKYVNSSRNVKCNIDLDEYEYRGNKRGYQLYMKDVNGKGKWVAQDQAEKYPPFEITYDQALGYEPIIRTNAERLGHEVGKMLLP